jgi:low temperature requirement protein LtrA
VIAGTAIYLVGNLLFKRAIDGKISYSHLTTISALGALAFAVDYLTPLILMTTISLLLVVLVIVEERSRLKALPTHVC